MKKVFTFIFVLCCTTWVMNAQMLATFEDGANDLMAIDPTFWYMPELFVAGGAPQIGSNTDKSGLNKSDKCFLAVNVANADWWGNFISLKLVNPITVTESNRYLRFMAYRSIQPKNFRIGINGREDANSVYQNKLKNDGVWEGVVADLGTNFMGQEIKDIEIIFSNNWDDPRTGWGVATYMFDNFELSNTPIPPGINVMDGTGLSIGFENQAETDKWVNTIDMQNAANTYKIIDNPFTSSTVDNGGKIFQFDKSDQASWWQGARFDFTGIMPVGNGNPNQLHVMVYVPAKVLGDLPSIDIQLCAKDHMGNENTQIFTVWDDQVDEWMDLVMQIDKITYLKEVTVRFDIRRNADDTGWINSPANTFYLDAIAFDNDPNPRAKIITGLPEVLLKNTLANIRTLSKAIQVDVNQKAGVQVYNVLGGLVKSISLDGSATIDLETGIYIVKIASATGQKQISKVLVK